MKKEKNEGILWDLPKNSWRFASALGTTSIVVIAVVMHVFGWITDSTAWMIKGLWGIAYAAGYFLICIILKLIHDAVDNTNSNEISVEELLKDVKVIKK